MVAIELETSVVLKFGIKSKKIAEYELKYSKICNCHNIHLKAFNIKDKKDSVII